MYSVFSRVMYTSYTALLNSRIEAGWQGGHRFDGVVGRSVTSKLMVEMGTFLAECLACTLPLICLLTRAHCMVMGRAKLAEKKNKTVHAGLSNSIWQLLSTLEHCQVGQNSVLPGSFCIGYAR